VESGAGRPADDRSPADIVARNLGVGCVTAVGGLFSGGMVGVLISKIVAFFTRAPSCPELPTCDWYVYAAVGMAVGVVTLPLLTLMRLRRSDARTVNPDRG
jgi:hypothetical protein